VCGGGRAGSDTDREILAPPGARCSSDYSGPAIELAADPEDTEQGADGGEGAQVRPERDAGFQRRGLGQGLDLRDEIGELGGLDHAVEGNLGHFLKHFGSGGPVAFFDFHALGEQCGFKRFVLGSTPLAVARIFPTPGISTLKRPLKAPQADSFFWGSVHKGLSL